MTAIIPIEFTSAAYKDGAEPITGVMMADKVGEIYFLNSKHLPDLPSDPETVPGRNDPAADDYDYKAKLLYGHQ